MNEIITAEEVKTKIYVIRGKEVMLDSDLAKIFGCTNGTKDINKAVKRNLNKFPEDFYFQLTKEEYENLKFQIGTSSWNSYGGVRKLPYVFTEQGVAMLSSVLHTENAAFICVNIMRAFVLLRHYYIEQENKNLEINNIETKLIEHDIKFIEYDKKFDELFDKFNHNDFKRQIFYQGEIYEAYSKIIDFMNEAINELIIIDRYADKTVLDIITNLKVPVTLFVKRDGLLKKLDITKYQKNHHNLKIVYDDSFHDRFLIIDQKTVYHLGASLNHAGERTFAINKIEDKEMIKTLISKVENLKK